MEPSMQVEKPKLDIDRWTTRGRGQNDQLHRLELSIDGNLLFVVLFVINHISNYFYLIIIYLDNFLMVVFIIRKVIFLIKIQAFLQNQKIARANDKSKCKVSLLFWTLPYQRGLVKTQKRSDKWGPTILPGYCLPIYPRMTSASIPQINCVVAATGIPETLPQQVHSVQVIFVTSALRGAF